MKQGYRQNKNFTQKFKAEVLKMINNGEAISSVAIKMNVSENVIKNWKISEINNTK